MEAVGILGGHADGRAAIAIPLPNLAGPKAFLADPLAQYQAERELRQAGLTLLAVYHSHPGGGTRLSAVDQTFAARLPVMQVVIALARLHRAGEELRAYQIREGMITEVPIRVSD